MKKAVLLSVLSTMLVACPLTLTANAQCECNSKAQNTGYISVSYTAEKEVAPDTVEFSIAIRTSDKKSMQEAVRKNKEISDNVYTYLKSVISEKNGDYLKTSNYSAAPNYIYTNGKEVFEKYEVSNNIIVHTKSINDVATYIDKSILLGATNVQRLNFSLSEKDVQCSQLLAEATKNVKQRATIVANSAGATITGIKSIDTSCSVSRVGAIPTYSNRLLAKSASMDNSIESTPTQIEAGVIKVYSTVNALFYVK